MTDLWHYTCAHGRREIGNEGRLVAASSLTNTAPWMGQFIWMTDLAVPLREALGLTSTILTCDRTQFRYRVTDASLVVPWTTLARDLRLSPAMREPLEAAPGARPRHWFVSIESVPVAFDPIPVVVA